MKVLMEEMMLESVSLGLSIRRDRHPMQHIQWVETRQVAVKVEAREESTVPWLYVSRAACERVQETT